MLETEEKRQSRLLQFAHSGLRTLCTRTVNHASCLLAQHFSSSKKYYKKAIIRIFLVVAFFIGYEITIIVANLFAYEDSMGVDTVAN